MLASAPLVACNSDDIGTTDTPPVPEQPACAGGDSIIIGQLYECSGTRKARIDVQICAGLTCGPGSDNWQDIQEPLQGGPPLIPEEQLNIEQGFFSEDGNPPPTGACCDPNSPDFMLGDPGANPPDPNAGSVKLTAYNDCAARSCREVHDQLVDLASATQATLDAIPVIPFPQDGWAENAVQRSAFERAIASMQHYSAHLELPSAFQACTSGLVNAEGDSPNTYVLPDPPDPGAGSLRNLIISAFECPDLNCELAEDDPTTGGSSGGICLENPNWFEGNAAPSITGTGVPEQGTITLTLGDVDTEPQFAGVAVAYERLADCPADAICPFALTDLRFTLQDVSFGFLTFQTPNVSLGRTAYGSQIGDDIKIGDGEFVLRIESSLLFVGQPFLEGITLPFVVTNKGTVHMTLSDGVLEIQDARFDLYGGALARLVIAATVCDEE